MKWIWVAEIDELKELCERATPGPWYYDIGNGQVETELNRVVICNKVGNAERRRDALGLSVYEDNINEQWKEQLRFDNDDDMYFIAAARRAIPLLLCEIEHLEEHIKMLREMALKNEKDSSSSS